MQTGILGEVYTYYNLQTSIRLSSGLFYKKKWLLYPTRDNREVNLGTKDDIDHCNDIKKYKKSLFHL